MGSPGLASLFRPTYAGANMGHPDWSAEDLNFSAACKAGSVCNGLRTGFEGKDRTQGLKPTYFCVCYGPTKSRALIQNMSFTTTGKVGP
jgi:hypothetical protein